MSNPDDPVTDAPGEDADLDELLEQFREEEPLPKKKNPGPVWHVLAFILICLAFWLAVRASRAPLTAHRTTSGKMMPTKVRDRSAIGSHAVVDAKADYEERCRKGMTAEQVRWIVEDFQNAGLGEGPGSLKEQCGTLLQESAYDENGRPPGNVAAKVRSIALSLGNLQRLWYLNALVDGLSPDVAQKEILKTKLAGAFSRDLGQLEKSPADMDFEEWEGVFGLFLTPERWLEDEEYAPWRLCDLSDGQMAITRQETAEGKAMKSDGKEDPPPSWFELGSTADDGSEAPDHENEKRDAEAVFPLDPAQVFAEGDDLLGMVKRLHPAQLKTLLLLEPGIAGKLMESLEEGGE